MSAMRGKRSALPPMSDVAADLREGVDLGDLATALGVTHEQLRHRLNKGGWGGDGHPMTPEPTDPLREALATFLRGDLSWQDEASCAQIGGDVWYPDKGAVPFAGKRTCAACPVREECLEYALDNDEKWGTWGGLSPRERRKLKKERAA